ncbi:MAG: DNA/RNA nuclease SfsA [Syntrophobacterales bacterium]
MRFLSPLVRGFLVRRYQRFLAEVRLENDRLVTAHCPNSGSMQGCNVPGREVMLSPTDNPKRKTRYTWELIHLPSTWVGVNTLSANRLVAEAASGKLIPELGPFDKLLREVQLGHSRIDFCLVRGGVSLFLEVKNVTLVEDGTALFPDAPTARGRKHLQTLMGAIDQGHRAAMFYVVQREDAQRFSPAAHVDPAYAQALRRAHRAGVNIIVYGARVSPKEIYLDAPLPVVLEEDKG